MPSQKKNAKTKVLSAKRKREQETVETPSKTPKKNEDRMLTRLLAKKLKEEADNTTTSKQTPKVRSEKKKPATPKQKSNKKSNSEKSNKQDVVPAQPAPEQQPTKEERNVESILVPTQSSTKATEQLQKSLKRIFKHCAETDNSEGFEVEVDDDNLYKWRIKLFGFDKSLKLTKDLKSYQKKHPGRDHVLIEAIFPHTFPNAPPFLRVVYPRFIQYTGHVTIGGSICVEDLTLSGWKPDNLLESFFVMIRHLLVEGGARINFDYDVDYSEYEAKSAFMRVARDHGWKV